jgi:hypothetical protein
MTDRLQKSVLYYHSLAALHSLRRLKPSIGETKNLYGVSSCRRRRRRPLLAPDALAYESICPIGPALGGVLEEGGALAA